MFLVQQGCDSLYRENVAKNTLGIKRVFLLLVLKTMQIWKTWI